VKDEQWVHQFTPPKSRWSKKEITSFTVFQEGKNALFQNISSVSFVSKTQRIYDTKNALFSIYDQRM
jgi:hypothetical protein